MRDLVKRRKRFSAWKRLTSNEPCSWRGLMWNQCLITFAPMLDLWIWLSASGWNRSLPARMQWPYEDPTARKTFLHLEPDNAPERSDIHNRLSWFHRRTSGQTAGCRRGAPFPSRAAGLFFTRPPAERLYF